MVGAESRLSKAGPRGVAVRLIKRRVPSASLAPLGRAHCHLTRAIAEPLVTLSSLHLAPGGLSPISRLAYALRVQRLRTARRRGAVL